MKRTRIDSKLRQAELGRRSAKFLQSGDIEIPRAQDVRKAGLILIDSDGNIRMQSYNNAQGEKIPK